MIRALTDAASEVDVELVSLTPGEPSVYAGKAGTSTAVAPASAATSPLMGINLAVNVAGGYFQIEQFLDKAESLTRAFKVTALTIAPGDNPSKPKSTTGTSTTGSQQNTGKSLVGTVTGLVFMQNPAASTTTATTAASGTTTPATAGTAAAPAQ